MDYIWKFKVSPSPPAARYNELFGGKHVEGDDVWITEGDLKVLKHIPGVPAAYSAEERAGLVLYVRGVPFGIKSSVFRDIFMPFGRVIKSPVLISVGSQETFRWVVMKHADDAQDAKRALHGSTHESGSQLFISMGLKPGVVFGLLGKELPKGIRLSPESPIQNGINGHRHPSPPDLQSSKLLLPPIPRVAVPAVARPTARSTAQQPIGPPSHEATTTSSIPEIADSKEITKHSSEDAADKGKSSAIKIAAEQITTHTSSWANIASASDPDTRIIDLHPEHKSSNAAPRLNPTGRIPKVVNVMEEPVEEQQRLIFLLNLPNNIGLQEITNAVNEGPLVRIQFGFDNDNQARFVGIIFQYATHANEFYNVLMKERERSRPERFRFIVDVVRGEPLAADDIIRSMNDHPWATRRLTIVKGKFFFMFGERQLTDLCCKIAGQDNVQLVWLYNGGNATVVFADVESAIKVKKVLDKRANASHNGAQCAESIVWKGLQTTFSKDPCIHPLDLKTAIHD
ncbi:hypothetical protein IFR04_014756 [Cadophora malorum]|uniref:RRM domain-containing protein n=1 Tax=Cadophora malorum TaxID=108018 RepID=A0A8H7W1X6_9HELO|nr:hypothetical protein IFR04_014756 [Cadophora malorum]